MNKALNIAFAIAVAIAIAATVFSCGPQKPVTEERATEIHRQMIDGHNERHNMSFPYAVVRELKGHPVLASADYRTWTITFTAGARLSDEALRDTVAHETAHILDRTEHGRDSHGPEFNRLYRELLEAAP